MLFNKYLPWRPSSDKWLQKSPERFTFTTDWFCGNEKHFAKYLAHLADTPCRILEIGCYEGRATVWLIENIATHFDATITCIDIREQPSFQKNILASENARKVRLDIGLSRDLLRSYPVNMFDFIYIDGGHGTVEVLEDAVLSFRLLKCGGIMGFDDFGWKDRASSNGTPKPAINAFLSFYRHQITVLMKDYQVWIRKDAD
jgi:predicted O-methyltransferase YrrM